MRFSTGSSATRICSVGITKRLVPHQLRHSYGTEMTRAGVSLLAVMKLLGHLKPEMSLHYVEVITPGLSARVPSGSLPAPPPGGITFQIGADAAAYRARSRDVDVRLVAFSGGAKNKVNVGRKA